MTTQPSDAISPLPDRRYGGLRDHEFYWRERQAWLAEQGYMLRPRYRPDWKPSWHDSGQFFFDCEDGHAPTRGALLDATRVSDGRLVMLKKVATDVHPHEVDIGQFLSSKGLSSDARNNCVRILDVLSDPTENNLKLIVLPLLRRFYDPEFQTVGEVVACLQQLNQGLQFLHAQHVAHRDISILNVMLDGAPMYKHPWHPIVTIMKRDYSGLAKHYSRTEKPPKYYFIDFGLSRKYNPADGPPLELPIQGGDKSVPEFQDDGYDKPADPFRTDIYYLGSMIREAFLEKYRNMDFIRPLISEMVQPDPERRPTIDEVVSRAEKLFNSLSSWTLRSRLVEKDETSFERIVFGIAHVFRTARYVVKRLPAVPIPSY
ncbi:hypothetical protein FOMPIDRAFT_1034786 [Fomitopsis schrenkii]|uniref:Protein kinase domain-containing protein n=1 Tax=Fomitopsis schrenkii TaxID=2126942 RepID=S8G348_FOMSC|nr:hypothetical protein FOMPIDRAFT_1034786 [Fomitopsis schrenkii]